MRSELTVISDRPVSFFELINMLIYIYITIFTAAIHKI
jgi:hypothetical protein